MHWPVSSAPLPPPAPVCAERRRRAPQIARRRYLRKLRLTPRHARPHWRHGQNRHSAGISLAHSGHAFERLSHSPKHSTCSACLTRGGVGPSRWTCNQATSLSPPRRGTGGVRARERERRAGGRAREGAKRNRFTRTAARAASRPPPTPCSKSSTSRRAAPRCRPAPRTSSTSAATPPHSRLPLETPLQAPRLYTRRCAIRGPQGTRTAAKLHGSAHARACVACGWGGRGGCALTVWLALGEWGVWCGGSVCGGDAPKRTSVS